MVSIFIYIIIDIHEYLLIIADISLRYLCHAALSYAGIHNKRCYKGTDNNISFTILALLAEDWGMLMVVAAAAFHKSRFGADISYGWVWFIILIYLLLSWSLDSRFKDSWFAPSGPRTIVRRILHIYHRWNAARMLITFCKERVTASLQWLSPYSPDIYASRISLKMSILAEWFRAFLARHFWWVADSITQKFRSWELKDSFPFIEASIAAFLLSYEYMQLYWWYAGI